MKREIRHFHVLVVQKRAEKCTKSVTYVVVAFFDVLVVVRARVVGS